MFAALITTGGAYKEGMTEKQHIAEIENEAPVEFEDYDEYVSGSMVNEEFEDWKVQLAKSEKPFSVILSVMDESGKYNMRMEAEEMENLSMLLG